MDGAGALHCFITNVCSSKCAPCASSAGAGPGKLPSLVTLVKESPRSSLLGSDAVGRSQVDAWIYSAGVKGIQKEDFFGLDLLLSRQSFVCGTAALTLADIVAYFGVAQLLEKDQCTFPNVGRWFDQCAHEMRQLAPTCETLPLLARQAQFQPVLFPIGVGAHPSSPASTPSAPAAPKTANKEAAASSKENGKPKADAGGKKKEKPAAATSTPSKKAATATASSGGDSAPDPTTLDIRVGIIVKVWPHPESDKLFCEEIDIGEEKPRQIASGLRAFYSEDEMQGARCVVMTNLKGRKMAGFKSEGMVVCASNADHTEVKLLQPPPGAKPGDRFSFPGYTGEPITPAQVEKRKILEKCMPLFKTDAEGIACFDKAPFTIEGQGQCARTLPNATVG
jgi:aminoacyl tRNA synthase complex-interacting multifunctional protein 1